MKVIVYTQESAANAAIATCTAKIPRGKVTRKGTGRFAKQPESTPYTVTIKHPTEAKWALVADARIEAELGLTAEGLDDSWFPKSLFVRTIPQATDKDA
jgi:hypothetical protein